MIVIDASVLAAFILKEPGWEKLSTYVKNCTPVNHILKEVSSTILKAVKEERYLDQEKAKFIYSALK